MTNEDIHEVLELLVTSVNDSEGRDLPMPRPLASGEPPPSPGRLPELPFLSWQYPSYLAEVLSLMPASLLFPGGPFLSLEGGIKHPLAHIEQGLAHGGPDHKCCRCGKVSRVLVVTPQCAHLLCMGCTGRSSTACTAPGCGRPYLMQARDHPARRQDNPNPQADVPWQLIELQPGYTQVGARGAAEGAWQPDWHSTQSSKGDYLLRRLAEIAADAGPAQPRPKVIVFSQFWEHMLLLDLLLEQRGVRHATFGGDGDRRRNMRQHQKADALRE